MTVSAVFSSWLVLPQERAALSAWQVEASLIGRVLLDHLVAAEPCGLWQPEQPILLSGLHRYLLAIRSLLLVAVKADFACRDLTRTLSSGMHVVAGAAG